MGPRGGGVWLDCGECFCPQIHSRSRHPCSLAQISLFLNAGNLPSGPQDRASAVQRAQLLKPDSRHFPVISLHNRDSHPETGSHQTPPTAIWSGVAETSCSQSEAVPENSAIPRGLGRPGPRGSEPETAGCGPGRRSVPSSSLLPSWAVRIRFRFAPTKGSAWQSDPANSKSNQSW